VIVRTRGQQAIFKRKSPASKLIKRMDIKVE
jgi:hypothetical protein